MLLLIPLLGMTLTACLLLFLRLARPFFRFSWFIAAAGATLSLVGTVIIHLKIPFILSLAPWQPLTLFFFSPTWLVDPITWPYVLALSVLTASVILTAVVRNRNIPVSWAATLLFGSLGILAVTAGNPLTLILSWTALDLAELVIMIRTSEGSGTKRGILATLAVKVIGSVLVLWANLKMQAGGFLLDFQSIPSEAGIFLLAASALRLGVLPLQLPYKEEHILRRGLGTTLRLASAASCLCLLGRIPPGSLHTPLQPFLIILAAGGALYASWMWLRASDEIQGRPFWIMGMASLALFSTLQGNLTGTTAWGVMLILDGTMLFLFSARQRNITWLPMVAFFGLTSLPFSLTAAAWQGMNPGSHPAVIPFILAQSMLLAGGIRHALNPGETSIESSERWGRTLYLSGICLPVITILVLGFWGWEGARLLGGLWIAGIACVLAALFTFWGIKGISMVDGFFPKRRHSRFTGPSLATRISAAFVTIFRSLAGLITSSLEGDGGLLWSMVLIALIFSILAARGQ